MDVLEILIDKLNRLPPGDHSTGLKAVRLHVEAAIRHFNRGQKDHDETAFTDAIYRCNQAFEGSSKEAYRVLASKNPERVALAEVESFLTSSGILRKKVLDQFANYRKEWRNPSTHDYMLNFDEDEALLAIVSVTVFSIVLCDQIESKLAFLKAQSRTAVVPLPSGSLLDQVAEVVRRFPDSYFAALTPDSLPLQIAYERLEGGLAGYLSTELSAHNMRVSQSVRIEGKFEVDIVVESGGPTIAIELKVMRRLVRPIVDQAIYRLAKILDFGHFSGGVAFMLSSGGREYTIEPVLGDKRIRLVSPQIHAGSG